MTVNTAPILDSAADPTVPTLLEGATGPSGISITALVSGSITDLDGVLNAIAITGLNASLGSWQYSIDGGADWLTIRSDLIDGTADEVALLLGPTARIRLLPFGDLNGTLSDAITFRAWDESSGSEGDYTIIGATGGSTAFSDVGDTASVLVTAVNDAPTFGSGGAFTVPVGFALESATGVVVQADGDVVLGGTTSIGRPWVSGIRQDFAVVRLNADGRLDTTFNVTGKLEFPVAAGSVLLFTTTDSGRCVALQADGKILMGGFEGDNFGAWDGALVRLNADGALDTSFNATGKVAIPGAKVQAITLQSDGKIIAVGRDQGSAFAVSRLNADGSQDASFNGGATLLLPIGGDLDDAAYRSVTVQADGKIIVAGDHFDVGGNDEFRLIRLNGDGSLDASFNSGGTLSLPIGSSDDRAYAVALQADGKIVVAGKTSNGSNFDFAVCRVNTDGSLDTSFNGTGKLALPIGVHDDVAESVAVQADGKIVLAGYTNNGTDDDFALVRINADGTLDTSFNGSGKLAVPIGNGFDRGFSVSVEPDGRIVVAGSGSGSNGGPTHFAVIRVNPDGSLDGTFSSTDASSLDNTVSYTANAGVVALDPSVTMYDAELFASGNYAGATVTLARHAGASSDDLFSAMGNLALAGGNAVLSGVVIGTVTNSGGTLAITFNGNATQARVNETLSSIGYANASDTTSAKFQIDWTFNDGNSGAQGSGGALHAAGSTSVVVNDAPLLDVAANPVLDATPANPGGTTVSLLLAGASDADKGTSIGMAITAFDTSLGTWQYSTDGGAHWLTIRTDLIDSTSDELALLLDATDKIRLLPFGDLNGSLPTAITFRAWDGFGGTHGDYVAIAGTGGTTAFSTATDTAAIQVLRMDHAPTFAPPDSTGVVVVPDGSRPERSMALLADGTIIVAGSGQLVRLTADGTPDATFNSAAAGLGGAIAVQPDGKIVVFGETFNGSSFDLELSRTNADGTLDTSFNATGKVTVPGVSGQSISLRADGKIVVVGDARGELELVFNTDGTLDTSFALNFNRALPGPGGAVQPDGKIVAAFGGSPSGSGYEIVLFRANAGGSPDTSFNGTGNVTLPILFSNPQDLPGVAVQADGKILVAGYTFNGADDDFAVVRVNADGTLDTSFNGTGMVAIPIVWRAHPAASLNDRAYSVVVQPDGGILVAGVFGYNVVDFTTVIRLNPDGSLDSSFGNSNTNTLGGTILYTENAAAIALDTAVAVHDDELSAPDNYSGATLTLARHGGASSDDLFSAMGNLAFSGGNAVLSGVVIGTYTNSGGTLAVTFNGNATQARLNEALSSIGYANASDSPDASVQVDWTLSDGNSGAQGAGGALTATGSTIVSITPVNDAPTAVADSASAKEAGIAAGSNPTGNVLSNDTDPDKGDTQTVTAISAGTVGAARTGTYGTLTLKSDGSYVYILDNSNATVDALGPAGTLQDSFSYTMSDSAGATSSATLTIAIHGQNDAPTDSVTITGLAKVGVTLSAVGSIGDAEGIATPLGYQWQANGSDIAAATGSTYLLTPAEGGRSITVIVSYTDGGGTAESVTGTLTAIVGVVLNGTRKADHLIGGNGDDVIDAGLGRDIMEGLAGNDTYYVNAAHDVVIEQPNAGIDTVIATASYTLPANVENLTLAGNGNRTAMGNSLANVIIGNSGNNSIDGHGGADTITGAGGADTFIYVTSSDSTPGACDTITDFNHAEHDKIDLRKIDAVEGVGGNQAFTFIGTEAFPDFADASGLLRFDPVTHMLEGSTNADANPEIQILLVGIAGVGTGAHQISAADIVL